MSRKTYTKVIMNNGREYVFKKHPEDFMKYIANDESVLYQGFVHFSGVSINPMHISSIEDIEE